MNQTQIRRFVQESNAWAAAGRPLRPPARVLELYETVCTPCEHFGGDKCNFCGCNISATGKFANKLAWATTRCPLDPPKFEPESKENWVKLDIVSKIASTVVVPAVKLVSKCCGGGKS